VLAKLISRISSASFVLRDVISGRALIVVVVTPFIDRLLYFIDGIEGQDGHLVVLLIDGTSLAPLPCKMVALSP
jgi:hypothetical protein